MKLIQSRDNPFFKELVKLSGSARQRAKVKQTLLDGKHLLAAYLDTGVKPLHILLNGPALNDGEVEALLKRAEGVPMTQLDNSLFSELTELKTPSGLLTQVKVPQPPVVDHNFVLLLEDIQDPGNLGSVLRSAAAAGCDAVYLSKSCADAWSPRVLRAAMGGHFVLSIYEAEDLIAVAATFPGVTHAASLHTDTSLYDCDLCGSLAFAIGNEGAGLSQPLLDMVQRPFIIPMPGKVESLNAAAATAVCLFEAVRQRSTHGKAH